MVGVGLRDDQEDLLGARIGDVIAGMELADDRGAVRLPRVVHEETAVAREVRVQREAQQAALATG